MTIDFKKYGLGDEEIEFITQTEEWCIGGQDEIVWDYKGKSFVLEPHGEAVHIYAYGEDLGDYESFEDMLLNHKIDGKPLIELAKELDYGD